jgi:hypothetical protein
MRKISHPARNEPHCRMILFQLRRELPTIARWCRKFAAEGLRLMHSLDTTLHDRFERSSRQVSSTSVTIECVFRMWKARGQAAQTWLSASKIEGLSHVRCPNKTDYY